MQHAIDAADELHYFDDISYLFLINPLPPRHAAISSFRHLGRD